MIEMLIAAYACSLLAVATLIVRHAKRRPGSILVEIAVGWAFLTTCRRRPAFALGCLHQSLVRSPHAGTWHPARESRTPRGACAEPAGRA